jgi:hypothetical protein
MSTTHKPTLKVLDRWRGREIASVPTASPTWAVQVLVRSGVSLRNANLRGFSIGRAFLRGADFRGADLSRSLLKRAYLRDASLRGSDLRYADLTQANLQDADLTGADLSNADLSGCDLRGARLVGAELQGVCLDDAKLDGAILDWRRGTVAAEILRRAASRPGGKPRLVLDLLLHGERDDLPWLAVLGRHPNAVAWAVGLLATHVRPGDNAPPFLKRFAADLGRRSTRGAGVPSLSWTRRSPAR